LAACLGYRQSAREGPGTWITRAYDEDQRGYRLKALGDFGDLPGRDRFAAAKKEGEAFAELVEAGGRIEETVETVEDACRRYAKVNTERCIVTLRFQKHLISVSIKLGAAQRGSSSPQ